MAKNSKKSTRKFEKNHLKETIDRRKAVSKIKQRQQIKTKRKAKNDELHLDGQIKNSKIPSLQQQDLLAKMSMDDYYEDGLEIPKKSKTMTTPESAKRQSDKRKRSDQDSDYDKLPENTLTDIYSSGDSEGDDSVSGDIGMNKEIMDGLAEKDPEFYDFLKDNDPEALNFNENPNLSEISDLSASEKDQPRKKRKKSNELEEIEASDTKEKMFIVEIPTIDKWKKAMIEQHSLRAMRQVILAFRAAVHINEDENKLKYSISSSEVYHELIVTALEKLPLVLQHHLPAKGLSGKGKVSTDTKKFRALTPLLKSFFVSINHLLSSLSDSPTIKMILSSLILLIPYILTFKKLLKIIIKTVAEVWSDASQTEVTRITAFLVLRKLVVVGDSATIEAVLKFVYQGLIRGSRKTSMYTVQGINLMKNSASELWGINPSVGYATGFCFIRQLATHLRNCIVKNHQESYKSVYNWQYVHSLDFWSCVLSEHCSSLKEAELECESQLRPLIYPTVQITLGTIRLVPTAVYFPLRFYLIRSLLRLSRSTGTFIPLAPSLLEVLNFNEMRNPQKASTLKPFDFTLNYKSPKSYLHTRVYQEGVGEQIVELLAEYFVLWSTNIAFPELALPTVVMLKRWLRDVKKKDKGKMNGKINNLIILLVQKLDTNAKWIEEKRANVDFAPNNKIGVEEFLKGFDWKKTCLGAFVASQRKLKEEKWRLIEEGRKNEEINKKVDVVQQKEGSDVEQIDDSSDSTRN